MSVSVVNTRQTRSSENITAPELFPEYIRSSSLEIISFIRDYYNYLNSAGQPSYEIANIVSDHDIDSASDFYLNAIQSTIAKSIPESRTLDKVRLYKIIALYYNSRGSEESIYTFFKLFFNEIVTLFYPKDYLFDTSGERSVLSDRYRLQDGIYWQDYSYVIKSNNPTDAWRNEFLKFVHPAGLKLFTALTLIAVAYNNWENDPASYMYDASNPDTFWSNIRWDDYVGLHTPKFQAGIDYDLSFLFRALMNDGGYSYRKHTYGVRGVSDADLFSALLLALLDITLRAANDGGRIFRSDYQAWLKYDDTLKISDGFLDKTIGDAIAPWADINNCRFEALATNILINDNWFYSYGVYYDTGSASYWTNSEIEEYTISQPQFINSFAPGLTSIPLTFLQVDIEGVPTLLTSDNMNLTIYTI